LDLLSRKGVSRRCFGGLVLIAVRTEQNEVRQLMLPPFGSRNKMVDVKERDLTMLRETAKLTNPQVPLPYRAA